MCFVLQSYLGKGSRCAPPLHPPGPWLLQGIEPIPKPSTVSPVDHSQRETSLSPAPHRSLQEDHEAIAPLGTHSQDLETCLSTCTGPCTNGCPFDHQSGERSCSHRHPHDHFMETKPARIGWRHLSQMDRTSIGNRRARVYDLWTETTASCTR